MQRFLAFDGTEHPVRAGFNIWPLGWSEAEEMRVLERWRGQPPADKPWLYWLGGYEKPLNDRERLVLDAWTNRKNINNALAFLQGCDYRDFGFETVCQIHGNRHTRPCGCDFHCVFDHHKRARLTDADMKPLRALFVCPAHVGNGDLDTQFWGSARGSAQAA